MTRGGSGSGRLLGESPDLFWAQLVGRRGQSQTHHPYTAGDPGAILKQLDVQPTVVGFDDPQDAPTLSAVHGDGHEFIVSDYAGRRGAMRPLCQVGPDALLVSWPCGSLGSGPISPSSSGRRSLYALATLYRSWRVRSSRSRPGLPPRFRDLAAWRPRSERTAFGSLVMVFFWRATRWAFRMFRRAASVCRRDAMDRHLLNQGPLVLSLGPYPTVK